MTHWNGVASRHARGAMDKIAQDEFGLDVKLSWAEYDTVRDAQVFTCSVVGRKEFFSFVERPDEDPSLGESAERLFREWRLWLKGDRIASPGVKLRPGRRSARTALKLVRPVLVTPWLGWGKVMP